VPPPVLRVGHGFVATEPPVAWERLADVESSPVRCVESEGAAPMIAEIDKATREGNTVGGVFEVVVKGLPPGLGSFAQWDRRLDGRLAQALMSIQAVKAVS